MKLKHLFVVFAAVGFVYAAEDSTVVTSTNESNTTGASVSAVQRGERTGLEKSTRTIPGKKTNWSKIKDLFM